ncbi:MAG: hypothetical protein JWN56_1505 [Sphingobacteriales bacterium]|nr:hypothetical protein [Sphingobacteriales bacterium]
MKLASFLIFFIFLTKLLIPVLPIFVNNDQTALTKVVVPIEDESKKESEKEEKLFKEYFSKVSLFSFCILAVHVSGSLTTMDIFFINSHFPSVLTPPPNLS